MQAPTVELRIPPELRYRSFVLAACSNACQLTAPGEISSLPEATKDPFVSSVISAMSEVFNNIVRHANPRSVRVTIEVSNQTVTLSTEDDGSAFELTEIGEPDMSALPESGLGLYIARSFVDTLEYIPGPPNRWILTKRRVP